MSHLTLSLLGAPHISVDQRSVDLPRRKVMALFLYVALADRPVARDRLATMLWPESEPKSARAALRRELHGLTQAIGPDWLDVSRDEIGLNTQADITIDVHTFRRLLVAAAKEEQPTQWLVDAVECYRGDFLAGFTLSDCPIFDDWQFFEAAALRRDFAGTLAQLVEILREQQQYDSAATYARRWLALDTLDESVHRELMAAYALAGQQAAAVRQYDECVRILDEELGVPPAAETVDLYEQIRTRQFPAAANSTQPGALLRSAHSPEIVVPATIARPPTRPHNLPPQNSSFVGRQTELAAITEILQTEESCHLLTLVGPGGIGKTRLALQVAQQFVDEALDTEPHRPGACYRPGARYRDGIYFVPLEAVADGDQFVAALANAIGFTFPGNGQPLEQLTYFLQTKELLLILDNFEQLQAEAELLATLLQGVPGLTVIATSREALSLQEEWLYAVTGFALPSPPQAQPTRDLTINLADTMFDIGPGARDEVWVNSAVQLFIQRARRVDSSLPLSDEQLAAPLLAQIVRICHLVDGLPLGLELAATWVRTLSLSEIADEIARDLDFLATTRRGQPERHSSIRAVLEQTWRLLTPTEQAAFCRLAYFQNGFTRQAATRVADASMVLLAALVRKSIISHGRDGRYRMHGLLRQFATARLQADPPSYQTVAANHSRYFGHLLASWQDEFAATTATTAPMTNIISKDRLAEIGDEIENIRLGWRWAVTGRREPEQIALVNRYIDALFHFYDTRSRFQEGWTEFSAAVHALEDEGPIPETHPEPRLQLVQGRLYARLGWFAFQIGQAAEAKTALQQGLALLRPLEHPPEIIFALNYLGAVHRHGGEYGAAVQILEESRRRCQASGDQFGLTVALNILGQVAYEEQAYTEAQGYLAESMAIKETIGDRRGTTYSLLYLGLIAQAQADPAKAIRLFQESQLISEEYGDRRGVAIALSNWADVEASLDHTANAADLYAQSLVLYTAIYNLLGMVTVQIKLGDLARAQDDTALAEHHYAAALEKAHTLPLLPQALAARIDHAQQWLTEVRPYLAPNVKSI